MNTVHETFKHASIVEQREDFTTGRGELEERERVIKKEQGLRANRGLTRPARVGLCGCLSDHTRASAIAK